MFMTEIERNINFIKKASLDLNYYSFNGFVRSVLFVGFYPVISYALLFE